MNDVKGNIDHDAADSPGKPKHLAADDPGQYAVADRGGVELTPLHHEQIARASLGDVTPDAGP